MSSSTCTGKVLVRAHAARGVAAALTATLMFMVGAPASADFVRQTDFAKGSEAVTVVRPANVSQNVTAGGFAGFHSAIDANLSSSPFLSYCIELTQTFSFDVKYINYSITSVASAPNSIPGGMGEIRAAALARMLGDGRFADSFTSTVKSVAMQLAIWEVVYETAGNVYNVGQGGFRLTSSESAAILGQAATYLGFTASGTAAQVVALTSEAGSLNGNQDFITVVPVPPSAALLASGLLVGLWAARRRRNGG